MHKSKDGKVLASLTEVKNKTGDIFALVDEYGEIYLTSYNKERYKIVKIGVESMLDTEEEKTNTRKSSQIKEEKKMEKEIQIDDIKQEEEEKKDKDNQMNDQIIDVRVWVRDSEEEKEFISEARSQLISN